jgi:glycosyltransferase involved in cell wall biosynthesis
MADGFVCRDLDLSRCARCMAGFQWAQGAFERRLAGFLSGLRSATGVDLGAPARRARNFLKVRRPARSAEPDAAAVEHMGSEMRMRDAELKERVVRAVDLFLSPSRFLRERFVEWGILASRIEHVPTGVDFALFARGERAPRGAKLRIAFVGALIPVKGAKLLLEAFASLAPTLRARAELRIAGSARHAPDYQRELAALASRTGAQLVGELAREDVSRLLHATDLLVVPSLWFENAPLVILEALAARTPLCVSNQGGMAELVEEGRSGFRFELGDARDLAAKLARVIERPELLDALYARPVALPSFAEHAAAVEARYRRLVDARAAQRA